MSRRRLFVFGRFFLAAAALFAAGWDETGYDSLSGYLLGIYGVDENAGLTAFPVLNVPMGGRFAAMSGAFSAVSSDVTFLEGNPAGSATLPETGIAFFHNNWIADTKLEGVAFSSRIGNFGFGAAGKWLWTPFTQYGDFGEYLSKGYYSEAAGALNFSYNFFRTYYFDGLSFGVNLKAALRSVPDYADYADYAGYSDYAGGASSGTGASQSAFALMGDAGFLTRLNLFKLYHSNEKNMAFALVLRNYGGDVAGDPLPTAVVAAVSYKPLRPLTLSFDAAFPLYVAGFTGFDLALSEKPSFSFGISGVIARFLRMSGGFTLKAGAIRAALGAETGLENMTFYLNYTLDLATQFQPLNRVSVGIRFNMGDGGRAQKRDKAEKTYLEGMQAYNEGRFGDAHDKWQETLLIDAKFLPAVEALFVLDNFESLEDRITKLLTEGSS